MILFYSRRSTVPDNDRHGAVEGEADKRAGAFAHTGWSFLHHGRHTSQISGDVGDRPSPTLRRGGWQILLRGRLEMRPGGGSSRVDHGPGRGYREDAATGGGGEADEEAAGR